LFVSPFRFVSHHTAFTLDRSWQSIFLRLQACGRSSLGSCAVDHALFRALRPPKRRQDLCCHLHHSCDLRRARPRQVPGPRAHLSLRQPRRCDIRSPEVFSRNVYDELKQGLDAAGVKVSSEDNIVSLVGAVTRLGRPTLIIWDEFQSSTRILDDPRLMPRITKNLHNKHDNLTQVSRMLARQEKTFIDVCFFFVCRWLLGVL
jgi:hypothetical protein